MNDLIERINQLLARSEAFKPPEHVVDLLEDCLEALKPVEDADMRDMIASLTFADNSVCSAARNLIERLAREKAELQAKVEELTAALEEAIEWDWMTSVEDIPIEIVHLCCSPLKKEGE